MPGAMVTGMIEELPDYPALQAIQRALWHVSDVRGAAVMVGSGFSAQAELPSPASRRPPLWSHMAAAMEQQLGPGSAGAAHPLRLAEEFRALLGQAALDGLIRDLVPDAEWLPGRAHRRLLDLPWSDVLTTNWDTLLERAKADLPDRSYDVVLTPADIARTRSPRIVKLHGTLPSHTPFVFAEEDYRTYPVRFAPFVNLAQHVLLENELLLVGFSGDDPNFLAWAGWVRDQLGASARRIRLAGVLGLTPARRRYLENLNVTPIDLAPLVSDVADVGVRHARATAMLIDALHDGKPTPIHVWKRASGDAQAIEGESVTDRLDRTVREWAADRECAPPWLVAPHFERTRLRMDTSATAGKLLADLPAASPAQRGRFAAELAWRLEAGHFGLPGWAKAPFEDALDDEGASLAPHERTKLHVQLALGALEERDYEAVGRHAGHLGSIRDEHPEAAGWSAYLKGLDARDRLDIAGVVATLPEVRGSDPVWLFRRAALMCAAYDSRGAARLVRDAMFDIRRRRSLDRRSLWLLSREAWGRFLWRHLSFELREEEDRPDLGDDWPLVYDEHRIDPWDELNALEGEVRQEQDRRRKTSGAERVHFEPGSWTPPASGHGHWVSEWVVPSELQIRRVADLVGLPWRAANADVLAGRLARSLPEPGPGVDDAVVWRVASYLRSEDGDLIDAWFGRVAVAALPAPLAEALISALRASVRDLAASLAERGEGYSDRVEGLRGRLELLSRLSVRADPGTAGELIELAIATFEHGGAVHWWLYRATSHLIARSLSAIPPDERGALTGRMLAFPLPKEGGVDGIERDWPEFSEAFRPGAVSLERKEGEWSGRIATLIDWTTKDRGEQRHRAIQRLWLLHAKRALTDTETAQFARAAWSWRTSPTGLPADVSFYPGAMAMLPEPEPGIAAAAFAEDVLRPLLSGKVGIGALESIAFMGSEADKGRATRLFDPATARDLILSIPWSEHGTDGDAVTQAISFGLLPIVPLDDTLAEVLWNRSIADGETSAVLFLPHIARHDPSRAGRAAAVLERAVGSRDFGGVNSALEAVRIWARLVPPGSFPSQLARTVVNLVAVRREPGLFRALDVCVDLADRTLLSSEDVRRLQEGLGELLVETDYGNWRWRDFRSATLTYVRANAVRLARALARGGNGDRVTEEWIRVAPHDPAPEVRFVTDAHD